MTTEAKALYRRAREAWEREDWPASVAAYEELLARFPDHRFSPAWWFDAALAAKFLHDWPRALRLGVEAAARTERGTEDPAFWNLGIAATALRDWPVARDAWAGYGIDLPPGDGEIQADFGVTCVRVSTAGGQEVVWAQRLCPARARVLSIPFSPDRRFGEVVLHDGAPNGERVVGEDRFLVFDELMPFTPSAIPTLSCVIRGEEADFVALSDVFDEFGLAVEPADSGRTLCRCCSEGSVATARDLSPKDGERQMLLAASEEQARTLLELWVTGNPSARSWSRPHVL
ncbi:tetratricopeptide repeat protein [Amycolatopsis suaedae]|uniref:Tetratricopeptide repeat protein n=1 Tax=Amycolatopsis suaedae TaxID=2510978 RepID=A0A4Q7JD96_9PSEU|nr:tetratricopeptide repeat protein [Amycolatopsis suaedae]RZQ65036.1 tetratricopeptide repeat protein [Amycolatopsis suaedae]